MIVQMLGIEGLAALLRLMTEPEAPERGNQAAKPENIDTYAVFANDNEKDHL